MEDSFEDCYALIASAQNEAGLALIDIVRAVHAQIITLGLPAVPFARLVEAMADLEYSLTTATCEKVPPPPQAHVVRVRRRSFGAGLSRPAELTVFVCLNRSGTAGGTCRNVLAA